MDSYFTQRATHTVAITDVECRKHMSTYCSMEGANWVGTQKVFDSWLEG